MATLDHVVVNVLRGMDEAAACFAALGFALTPLGRHTLGSINHLMMTPGPYLELVGVPEERPWRQEVIDSPFGLNGLVMRAANADATAAAMRDAGLPTSAPMAFSRPVTFGSGVEDARFRTVRFPTETFPAGRVYYCEHLTPDLVWRPEWLDHPNGFVDIDRLVVASLDPARDAGLYALACGGVAARDGDGWIVRLGAFTVAIVSGAEPCFKRLGLVFKTIDALEQRANTIAAAHWERHDATTATLDLPALALTLDCRSAG
jgi:hypothetical protein